MDSKNITITYDGVSHQKDWAINGSFDSGVAPWEFVANNTDISTDPWQGGNVTIKIVNGPKDVPKGSYGYYEYNFTLPETLATDTKASLSMNYKFRLESPFSPSSTINLFISTIIGGIEINKSLSLSNLVEGSETWIPMKIPFDLLDTGQQLPENVTLRAGVFVNETTALPNKIQFLNIDDIKFTLWTKPNLPNLLIANDTDDNYYYDGYNYTNSAFGKGSTFINEENSEDGLITFTILKNDTFTEEFEIHNITITSEAEKIFNSTVEGQEGSRYTKGIDIVWYTECDIDIPSIYLNNWAEITKPNDWNVTSILDGYGAEKINNCTGTNIGSEKVIIKKSNLRDGKWKIEATSQNYISEGNIGVWKGKNLISQTRLTFDDKFQINLTVNNNTFSPMNTQVNCIIEYPNGTIFFEEDKILVSNSTNFGNFTVGNNMTVGTYQVILVWTNDQSYLSRDKVGFLQFEFDLWHHTNLTAVNFYEEKVSGEPFLMKVNFTDTDSNTHIDFATITYNSTLTSNASGTMVYFGSGIYVADMDLSGEDVGDFYFSFNATNRYFENHSMKDLIHLKIINQSLIVEVSQTVINVDANSYAVCNVNVTGAISGTLISGTNITTDWVKNFSIANHLDGTFTLTLYTSHLPTQGIVETFTVTIFATKVNFGSGSAFLSLTVNPIATIVNVNETIIDVYLNSSFSLKLNYTIESSGEIISDFTLNVSWASSFNVFQVVDGYIVNFSTTNLSLDIYTILFRLSHPGFETSYSNVYVNIMPKSTYAEIFLNQDDKTSDKSLTIAWNNPLNITILYKESISNQFISGASIELNGAGFSEIIPQIQQKYTLILSPGELPIGIHFLTITAQKENYNIVPSIIKITIEQIEIHVETIGVNGTSELFAGDSFSISIILTEEGSGKLIENANVSYSWLSYLDEKFTNIGDGIYEAQIKIPDSEEGSYTIDLIIIVEGSQYKNRNFPLNIYVTQRPTTNYFILVIIIALLSVIGVLTTLSVRSYVIIPRKRKKDRLFQNTIQVFKDVKNIQAVMFIQRNSGVPFFNKNYASFDTKDNALLSGFIQAITIFGEQMINGAISEDPNKKSKDIYSKNIIELNFKYFHLLICDYQSVRSLLILREKSSERLKRLFYLLSVEIDAKLGDKIEKFTGNLTEFESNVDILLNEFLSLYYSEPYKLIKDASYMQYLKKSRELQSIESRILNVIIARTKFEKEFSLYKIVEEIDEKNVDAIFGGLHTLIARNIIVPIHYKQKDSHPLLGGFK